MKKLQVAILAVVVILGAGAGIAKVMRAPAEVAFLSGIGLDEISIVAFGVLQLAGAALLIVPKSRAVGAIVAGLGFGLSTVAIFAAGNLGFGLFSVIPVLLTGWLFFASVARKRS